MSFDTGGVLSFLAAQIATVTGIQSVSMGAPASIGNQVIAYVALGAQSVVEKATGLLQREADYYVGLAYAVQDAPASAETTIAAVVDALIALVYADKTLGGRVTNATLDLTLVRAPLYQDVLGQEYRVYPVIVRTTQQDAFVVNP